MEEGVKGKISAIIREGKPIEVTFEGDLVGYDISLSIRAIMKKYKVWKSSLIGKRDEFIEEDSKEVEVEITDFMNKVLPVVKNEETVVAGAAADSGDTNGK